MLLFVRCDNVSCYRYVSAGNRRQIKVTSRHRTRDIDFQTFLPTIVTSLNLDHTSRGIYLEIKSTMLTSRDAYLRHLPLPIYYIFFSTLGWGNPLLRPIKSSMVNAVENSTASHVPHSYALPAHTQLYINYGLMILCAARDNVEFSEVENFFSISSENIGVRLLPGREYYIIRYYARGKKETFFFFFFV